MIDQAILGRLVFCLEGPADKVAPIKSCNRGACSPGRAWSLISKHYTCRCKPGMHKPLAGLLCRSHVVHAPQHGSMWGHD